ncbi:FeoB-associated Cys-rich membrane protein [Caloramator quimbayensis]|nr:FeoB-associated Cys-rich membrane protein [Caloramator quimbayensis]
MVEIIITSLIAAAALYFLYKSIKKKASGKCDCSSCSSHCSKYNTK